MYWKETKPLSVFLKIKIGMHVFHEDRKPPICFQGQIFGCKDMLCFPLPWLILHHIYSVSVYLTLCGWLFLLQPERLFSFDKIIMCLLYKTIVTALQFN